MGNIFLHILLLFVKAAIALVIILIGEKGWERINNLIMKYIFDVAT